MFDFFVTGSEWSFRETKTAGTETTRAPVWCTWNPELLPVNGLHPLLWLVLVQSTPSNSGSSVHLRVNFVSLQWPLILTLTHLYYCVAVSDAEETIAWMVEKDPMLSTDDYGRDLASVQALQRKHDTLERDLNALEEKVCWIIFALQQGLIICVVCINSSVISLVGRSSD